MYQNNYPKKHFLLLAPFLSLFFLISAANCTASSLEEIIRQAENGSAEAQADLGWTYFSGKGVEKNYEKSFFWYKKAAEQGLARAQVNLGILYETGLGVEKNTEQAKFWYSKTAAQGFAKAARLLRRIETKDITTDKGDNEPAEVEATALSSDSKDPGPDDQPPKKTETFLYVSEDTVLVKRDPTAPPPFIIKITKGTRVVEKARQGDWVSVVVADTGRGGWILSSQLKERTSSDN